jgi:dihydrofolate synthase/folylpolyglutamate synthase
VEKLTTFEITTALGFLYFARQQVDVAVIEVGLGGRLDATNVVTPRVSVITSLSYDHMAVLGDTLAKIAAEKAGIIKHGVPVISAPQKQEALAVLETISAERQAELTLVGMDVLYKAGPASLDGQQLAVWTPGRPPVHLAIPLLGEHQVENAATAYAALKTDKFNLTDGQITAGFAAASWPCRFEIARREPPVIFDSAHNEDSFQRLDDTLQQFFGDRKVTLILGVSEDKHLAEMIRALAPRLSLLIATRADHPRALEAGKIVETAERLGVASQALEPVSAALLRALDLSAQDGSLVLSAGSMFVTAEAKTAWQQQA